MMILTLLTGAVASGAFRQVGPSLNHVRGPFAAQGSIHGLYPGATRKLEVRISNRTGLGVVARRIEVDVRRGSPNCGKRNLAIPGIRRLRKRVPSHSQRRVPLKVKLRRRAPAECQGASFPLTYEVRLRRR